MLVAYGPENETPSGLTLPPTGSATYEKVRKRPVRKWGAPPKPPLVRTAHHVPCEDVMLRVGGLSARALTCGPGGPSKKLQKKRWERGGKMPTPHPTAKIQGGG